MTDILSASIDVCVPSAIAAHREHKARLKRIAAKAYTAPPIPQREGEPIVPDEATDCHADFCCAQWFKRQEQLHPIATLEGAPAPIATLSVRKIQQACARHYGVTLNDIVSDRRTKEVIKPRQVAIYLAKEMMTCSFPEIGKRFGDRDHTTVLHSFRKIERLSKTDTKLAADIAAIRERLA